VPEWSIEKRSSPSGATTGDWKSSVFVEDWAVAYGSPYLVRNEDPGAVPAMLIEDGDDFRIHAAPAPSYPRLAFVDGVRRGESSLYQQNGLTGAIARGVTGSHACGVVVTEGSGPAGFDEVRIHRLLIWGSGLTGHLPRVQGGWSWQSCSIADTAPDAPLRELQTRMRQEEGRLAEDVGTRDYLVILDGPLNFVRSRDLPLVGYVKTHHRALLELHHHRLIPQLRAGERSSIFVLGADRYSCYLRLALGGDAAGPWSGIVRLEIPQSAGLSAAKEVADTVAASILRFAGVAYRDPRAPQNLQPIGALETHLRHLLGDPGMAFRAVREAVSELREG